LPAERGPLNTEPEPQPRLVCRQIGEEVLVHDRIAGRVCFLNATAARVWQLGSAGENTAKIVEALCADYAAPDEGEVRRHVEQCETELRRLGLMGQAPRQSREDTTDET
jgi:hypothetical protein